MTRHTRLLILAMLGLAACLAAGAAASDTIRYVRPADKGGSYTGDGRSWATAKSNLQDAINDLNDYLRHNTHGYRTGSVYVAAGTYTPNESTEPATDGVLYTSFKIYSGISLYGSFNADAPEERPELRELSQTGNGGQASDQRHLSWRFKYKTVLTGRHYTSQRNPLTWDKTRHAYSTAYQGNSYHVVWFATAGFNPADGHALPLEREALLDGFVVRDGYASNRDIATRHHTSFGGGVYMVDNSRVRHCIVTQCTAVRRGGGVYMDGGGYLDHSFISHNFAPGVGSDSGYGGGVCVDYDGMVRHCFIGQNAARCGGGLVITRDADAFIAGNPQPNELRPAAAGCVISNNTATAECGGLLLRYGGLVNHCTVAANHCAGHELVYQGRHYGRSGGLYVDESGVVANTVCWGNTCEANADAQYAAFRPTRSNYRIPPIVGYSAFSNTERTAWTGTIKQDYYPLETNNTGQTEGYYPEFVLRADGSQTTNPEPGVRPLPAASNDNLHTIDTPYYTWTPQATSQLRSHGLQISDYPGNSYFSRDDILHANITHDYEDKLFVPKTTIGALIPLDETILAAMLPSVEPGESRQLTTIFVDPDRAERATIAGDRVGDSWDRPMTNIDDAISAINGMRKAGSIGANDDVQILVKEGTASCAGTSPELYYSGVLRSVGIIMTDRVRLYGGYPAALTGTATDGRNPHTCPTRISGNVGGDDYSNNSAHIVSFTSCSHTIFDGFQIYAGNATPNAVYTPAILSGAGIVATNYVIAGHDYTPMTDNRVRNCVIANCTAADGAAVSMLSSPQAPADCAMELSLENCIIRNCRSTGLGPDGTQTYTSPAAITATRAGQASVTLTLNHCTVRGNVGSPLKTYGAAVTATNTVFHANALSPHADIEELTAAPATELTALVALGGGTIAGHHCMADFSLGALAATGSAAAEALSHHSGDTAYPKFKNPTRNIGVTEDGDVTIYGGQPDFMPSNVSPLVNEASEPAAGEAAGTDLTACQRRDCGGLPDIGALESTLLPEAGKVIYVTTTGAGRKDGSSWSNAIAGNDPDYYNDQEHRTHQFSSFDAEPYNPQTERLTGLQWAVDEAFARSLKTGADARTTRTDIKTVDRGTQTVSKANVDPAKRVEVWVAAGDYTRRSGFFMREGVDVYGGFPAAGNPGMSEREPNLPACKTYLQTLANADVQAPLPADSLTTVYGPVAYCRSKLDYWAGHDFPTVSSYDTQESNSGKQNGAPVSYALDGDNTTFWHTDWHNATSDTQYAEHFVILDLGQTRQVGAIGVWSLKNHCSNISAYYCSDTDNAALSSATWTQLFADTNTGATATTSGDFRQYNRTFTPVQARFVKITLSGDYARVAELKVGAANDAQNPQWYDQTSLSQAASPVTRHLYDINFNYQEAYHSQRVLTQQLPYYADAYYGGNDAAFSQTELIGYDIETTWDGFTLRNGRVHINHNRDGGAGAALRTNGRLRNCIVDNCANTAGENRGGAIFCNNGTIENCQILGCRMYNIGGSTNRDSYGGGVYMRRGQCFNTSFIGNQVVNSATEDGSAAYFEDGYFYNNTVTQNKGRHALGTVTWFTSADVRIYNTIIYNNTCSTGKSVRAKASSQGQNVVIDHCLLGSLADLNVETGNGRSRSEDNIQVGADATAQAVFMDTSHSDFRLNDYRLALGSPAVNAGTEVFSDAAGNIDSDVSLPDRDAAYDDRVQDCAVDIGAYEQNSAVTITYTQAPETAGDNTSRTLRTYYVSQNGSGTRSGSDPQNAACWQKLQKVLDCAGRDLYTSLTAPQSGAAAAPTYIVRLAGSDTKAFAYQPRRTTQTVLADGEEAQPLSWSIIVPKGVRLEGGWNEQFTECLPLQHKTTLSGETIIDGQTVNVYHTLSFTTDVFDENGNKLPGQSLEACADTSIVSGVFIEGGAATAEKPAVKTQWAYDRYGGAAVVPAYAHIRNCVIQNNTSAAGGGGLCLEPNAIVSGCIVQHNHTDGEGGGIYIKEPTDADGNSTASDQTYAILACNTVVSNQASVRGGGLWFQTNVRAHSSLFWQNTSNDSPDIAGETNPTNESATRGISFYPLSFCGVKEQRVAGVDNIPVPESMQQGVRWADLTQDPYYRPEDYSVLCRTGLDLPMFSEQLNLYPSIGRYDIAGQPRVVTENGFLEIGARAYGQSLLVNSTEQNVMTRIYVSKKDVDNTEVGTLRNSADPYYSQRGSSMVYPMNFLDEAVDYVRRMRTNEWARNLKFEIFITGGTYYPMRNISGNYSFHRGCTYLVPEHTSIVGGLTGEEHYCRETSGQTTVAGVALDPKTTREILETRPVADNNNNNIIEPWEFREPSLLTGELTQGEDVDNAYHIISAIADADLVGLLPTSPDDYGIWQQGDDEAAKPHENGQPIVLDGLTIQHGRALTYGDAAESPMTYFKGGGICVDGKWTTGRHFRSQTTNINNPVGWRNIPLEIYNCNFEDNGAGRGGAIYTDGGLKIFGSHFVQNFAQGSHNTYKKSFSYKDPDTQQNLTAELDMDNYEGTGGAVCSAYYATIVNSIFANNEARCPNFVDSPAPGQTQNIETHGVGGAIVSGYHGRLYVTNCDFVRNLADRYPAVFTYNPNLGGTLTGTDTEQDLLHRNTHILANSVFWGNQTVSTQADDRRVYPFHVTQEGDSIEALWFCAYEDGRGLKPVRTSRDIDYRAVDFPLSEGRYVPALWATIGNTDPQSQYYGQRDTDPQTGLNPVTCNIILSSDNAAVDGPNFILPSEQAGAKGYRQGDDWMMGRLNSLVDQGWTYIRQRVSADDAQFLDEDDTPVGINQTPPAGKKYGGCGFYYTTVYKNLGTELDHATPIGEQPYMYYAESDQQGARHCMHRISKDPNPTHNQTYIDIGAYEYPHVKLNPDEDDETDILWVARQEIVGVGDCDGSTWERATSDLQRAIETLLASRNDHHKEIRMKAGQYMPQYILAHNLGFELTTSIPESNITPVAGGDYHGVCDITIRGGYSDQVADVRDIAGCPTYLVASKLTGATAEQLGHLVLIDDMRQRRSATSGNEQVADGQLVPVILDGLNLTNVRAVRDPAKTEQGGAALCYEDYPDDFTAADGTRKLTIANCNFMLNGIPTAILQSEYAGQPDKQTPVPAVTIGKGGGDALIVNSLFHSNSGNSLEARNTKIVNCTFALNCGPIKLYDTESQLHNSLLWRNDLFNASPDKAAQRREVDGTFASMTYNAYTPFQLTADADNHNNVLTEENNAVRTGPNFVNPDPDVENIDDATKDRIGQRDFRVNPAKLVLGQADQQTYTTLVGTAPTEDGTTPVDDQHPNRLKPRQTDLAGVARVFGGSLERGAYETPALLQRVYYVDPNIPAQNEGAHDWQHAYGVSQLGTALDAAAVYAAIHEGEQTAERDHPHGYVFVKQGTPLLEDDLLYMRTGVRLYGSIPRNTSVDCVAPLSEAANTDADQAEIDRYVSEIKAERAGLASPEATPTRLQAVATSANSDHCLIDGVEVLGSVRLDHGHCCLASSIVRGETAVTSGMVYNSLLRGYSSFSSDKAAALNCTAPVRLTDNEAHVVNCVYPTDTDTHNYFTPYIQEPYNQLPDTTATTPDLCYQLHECASTHYDLGYDTNGCGPADNQHTPTTQLPNRAALPGIGSQFDSYYDFDTDRDLLGNPRRLNRQIDNGCFELWHTIRFGTHAAASEITLYADRKPDSYGGNHYPHPGSVVYLQDGKLVCRGQDFTADKPLHPWFVSVSGGSLIANGGQVELDHVAVDRHVSGCALVSLPFAFAADSVRSVVMWRDTDPKIQITPADGYTVRAYDSEARAASGYHFQETDSKLWTAIPAEALDDDGRVKANRGFLFTPATDGWYRFMSNGTKVYTELAGETSRSVELTQHDHNTASKPASFTILENMGWNLTGVPYLVTDYATGSAEAPNPLVGTPTYPMSAPRVVYTLDPAGTYSSAQSWTTDAKVSVGDAFFTQTATTAATETLHFAAPTETYPATRAASGLIALSFGQAAADPAAPADLLALRPDSAARSLDFVLGRDGVKLAAMTSEAPLVAVRTAAGSWLQLAGSAPAAVEMPLSVVVPREGDYTFALTANTEEPLAVTLHDRLAGTYADLAAAPYTVSLPAAASLDDRFTLTLGRPIVDTETAVRIFATRGHVAATGLPSGSRLEVYTYDGILRTSADAAATGRASAAVSPGVYIAKAAGQVRKLVVR